MILIEEEINCLNQKLMDKKSKALLVGLDKQLTLLLRELKNYSDAKLNEQPDEKSWSVLQIMQHLMKSESSAIGYVQKKLSFNPALKKANLISSVRSSFLNIAFVMPLKLKAPAYMSGDALISDLTFWEIAKEWKQQRKELETYLQGLSADYFEKDLYKHPIGGRMPLSGMLSFFSSHMDRHIRQINRTLKKIDAVKQL